MDKGAMIHSFSSLSNDRPFSLSMVPPEALQSFFNGAMDQLVPDFSAARQADLPGETPFRVAVAVSGGADSLATLRLALGWASTGRVDTGRVETGKVEVYPLIVDHGLRPESADQAHQVAAWINKWRQSFSPCLQPPVVLRWVAPLGRAVCMALARQGRYQLLAAACHQRRIRHLLVGHHRQDVLETVWMRQRAGSSGRGLAGPSALTWHFGVQIVRPLLAVNKKDLLAWLRGQGIDWIEDPSNHDQRWQRTHARAAIDAMSKDDQQALWCQTLTHSLCRQEQAQRLALAADVSLAPGYLRVMNVSSLAHVSNEEGAVLIQAWLSAFGSAPPSLTPLMPLWGHILDSLKSAPNSGSNSRSRGPRVIATRAGCLFVRQKDDLWLLREPGRICVPVTRTAEKTAPMIASDVPPAPMEEAVSAGHGLAGFAAPCSDFQGQDRQHDGRWVEWNGSWGYQVAQPHDRGISGPFQEPHTMFFVWDKLYFVYGGLGHQGPEDAGLGKIEQTQSLVVHPLAYGKRSCPWSLWVDDLALRPAQNQAKGPWLVQKGLASRPVAWPHPGIHHHPYSDGRPLFRAIVLP
jgi:tRNA(Ile)-lysidine synthetase-like protein